MGGAGKAQRRESMLNCTTSGHGGGVLPAIPFHQTRHVTDETDADRRGTDTRGGWSGGSSVRPRRQRIQKSASVSGQPTNRWLVSGLRYASARLDRRSTPTVRLSVECFRRLNSGGECGAPRGRGGGRHGFRGASGGVPARGPGFSQISAPRARPSPSVFTLRKHSSSGHWDHHYHLRGGEERCVRWGGRDSNLPGPPTPGRSKF